MYSIFATSAKVYDLCATEFVCNKFGIAEYFTRAMESLNLKCDNALDVGCGVGPMMIYLADQLGARVSGVEINSDACQCCLENLRRYGLKNTCNVHECEFAAFANLDSLGKFDLIVSNPPLDVNISRREVLRNNAKGFAHLDFDAFSYLTNSWHDNDGCDLLDQIYDYAGNHLTPCGKVAISFCDIDGADLAFVARKVQYHGFKIVHSDMCKLSPASIGAENVLTEDVTAHFIVCERDNHYGD